MWRTRIVRNLDARDPIERRFNDLGLALLRNLSRPQCFGPTTYEDMAELVAVSWDEVLPWTISDEWFEKVSTSCKR